MARIEHFALFAHNLETLRTFYEQHFGLKVVVDNSRADPPGYFLGDGRGGVLEIIARSPQERGAHQRYVCHIAFWVDDFEGARKSLEHAGARFETDTVVDNAAMRTAFFNDPEGNRCQIVWRQRPLGSA
jgi:glyoxylase I family protein